MLKNIGWLFLFSFFLSCASAPAPAITGYTYHSHLGLLNSRLDSSTFGSDYDIYTYGDIRVYRFFYTSQTSYADDTPPSILKKSYYFVFHKDSVFGESYEPEYVDDLFPAVFSGRRSVDSVLRQSSFRSAMFESNFSRRADSTFTSSEGDLVKVFFFGKPQTQQCNSTSYLYYQKRRPDLVQEFSKALDNVKGKSLYKVYTTVSEIADSNRKVLLPAMENEHAVKAIKVVDTATVMKYVRKYKNG